MEGESDMAKVEINLNRFMLTTPVVLISAWGKERTPNIITIAWCGVICSDPPMLYASVRPSRHSYELLRENGDFVINIPTESQLEKVDQCGVVSGRNENKFTLCGFTPEKGKIADAPIIAECPVNIECRTRQVLELGVHHAFIGEVLATSADEKILDPDGKILSDFAPPVYCAATRSYHRTAKIPGAFYGYTKKESSK